MFSLIAIWSPVLLWKKVQRHNLVLDMIRNNIEVSTKLKGVFLFDTQRNIALKRNEGL